MFISCHKRVTWTTMGDEQLSLQVTSTNRAPCYDGRVSRGNDARCVRRPTGLLFTP